jgi:hypothetical protein
MGLSATTEGVILGASHFTAHHARECRPTFFGRPAVPPYGPGVLDPAAVHVDLSGGCRWPCRSHWGAGRHLIRARPLVIGPPRFSKRSALDVGGGRTNAATADPAALQPFDTMIAILVRLA